MLINMTMVIKFLLITVTVMTVYSLGLIVMMSSHYNPYQQCNNWGERERAPNL